MKNYFIMLAFACVLSLNVMAQEIVPDSVRLYPENQTGCVSFVFQSSNIPDIAFNNAKQWIAKNFSEYNDVVKMENATTRTLVFKGHQLIGGYESVAKRGFPIVYRLSLDYTATIECKEGRFRIKMEDLKPQGVYNLGGGKDSRMFLHFSDVDDLENIRNNPDNDKGFIALHENMIPASKATIATIVNSLEESINFKDDF
jgi:hypothetical protein